MRYPKAICISLLPMAFAAQYNHAISKTVQTLAAQPFPNKTPATPSSAPMTLSSTHERQRFSYAEIENTPVNGANHPLPLSLHQDLKRQSTSLFTGYGPVQTGVSFSPQTTGTHSNTTTSPSRPAETGVPPSSQTTNTPSNTAPTFSMGFWKAGLWCGVQLFWFLA